MANVIAQDVKDVLHRSTIEGNALRLPSGQLDRALYQSVNKILTALGGKWDRKSATHIFDADPAARISDALSAGRAISRQQSLQLFETPPTLASDLVSRLHITPQDHCLEPSAGHGRIIAALADHGAKHIDAVEIDPDNAGHLRAQGLASTIITSDFLTFDSMGQRYSAIAMNPPFRGNQDISHVRQAFSLLQPGGRLAAIVSEHGFIGSEKTCVEWRNWLSEIGAVIERIPAGAFKHSGTLIPTRMVLLKRAAA